jgi:NADH-quinone oxidoreductase subunit G
MREVGPWDGDRAASPDVRPATARTRVGDQAILDTWRPMLDDFALGVGEPYLAATARRATAKLSPATAAAVGVAEGDSLVLRTGAGTVTLPVAIADLPDGVVWAPTNSEGQPLTGCLGDGTRAGDVVTIEGGAS